MKNIQKGKAFKLFINIIAHDCQQYKLNYLKKSLNIRFFRNSFCCYFYFNFFLVAFNTSAILDKCFIKDSNKGFLPEKYRFCIHFIKLNYCTAAMIHHFVFTLF